VLALASVHIFYRLIRAGIQKRMGINYCSYSCLTLFEIILYPAQVLYNEQQVVEPVRVVPQYRKATSSSTRSALLSSVNLRPTSDRDEDRKPAVGTTRNYSHINEDGSFTFGYEGKYYNVIFYLI